MKTTAEKAHDRARRLGQQLARAKDQLERAVAVIRDKNEVIERQARRIKEYKQLLIRNADRQLEAAHA